MKIHLHMQGVTRVHYYVKFLLFWHKGNFLCSIFYVQYFMGIFNIENWNLAVKNKVNITKILGANRKGRCLPIILPDFPQKIVKKMWTQRAAHTWCPFLESDNARCNFLGTDNSRCKMNHADVSDYTNCLVIRNWLSCLISIWTQPIESTFMHSTRL